MQLNDCIEIISITLYAAGQASSVRGDQKHPNQIKTSARAHTNDEPDSADGSSIIELTVQFIDPSRRLNDSQTLELIKKHPSIIKHACRQAGKGLFGEKIKQARLPHVLEHLIIDLFVQDRAKQYAGNTAWSDRKVGIATIRIGLPESLGEVTDTGYSIYQQLISSAVNELNEFCMAGNVSHFNE